MKIGIIRQPRTAAAARAGLSANRRSSRNQTSTDALMVVNDSRSDLCRKTAIPDMVHLARSLRQKLFSGAEEPVRVVRPEAVAAQLLQRFCSDGVTLLPRVELPSIFS